MSETKFQVPDGLYYSKDHEYAKVEGSRVRVGITDYAQESLHDVVYVELPQLQKEVKQSVSIGAVESVKAASDLFAPVSGKVLEVNKRLEDEPELVNKDPYGEGWIAVIEPSGLKEDLAKLMDAQKYSEYLKGLGK